MTDRRYRIQKAAELSGVSEELIRAWERRYAVLAPERTEGGFRLYAEEDVALLRRLRQLTREGVPIGEAAKLVPQLRQQIAQEAQAAASQPEQGECGRWRQEIIAGAHWRDAARVERALDEALSALPPLVVFDDLIAPALREVGDLWHAGTLDVAQEHLVTQSLRQRMVSLLHGAPSGGGTHVLCACFPEEQHEVGALGAALRLRHAGLRVTLLGQRTPVDALAKLARSVAARAVALSAVSDPGAECFDAEVRALARALPKGTRVMVGGAAALTYQKVCERYGFRVFTGDWRAAVDWLGDLPSAARAG